MPLACINGLLILELAVRGNVGYAWEGKDLDVTFTGFLYLSQGLKVPFSKIKSEILTQSRIFRI